MISEEDVLWLEIAVDDSAGLQEGERQQDLSADVLEEVISDSLLSFLPQVPEQVDAKYLENKNSVLSELKVIQQFHNSILVVGVVLVEGLQNLDLHRCVLHVLLLVSADLQSHLHSVLLEVNALDHLPKGAFVNDFLHKVSVSNLLSHLGLVVAFVVGYLKETFPSDVAHCVDEVKLTQLSLLKHSQHILIFYQGFTRNLSNLLRNIGRGCGSLEGGLTHVAGGEVGDVVHVLGGHVRTRLLQVVVLEHVDILVSLLVAAVLLQRLVETLVEVRGDLQSVVLRLLLVY